MCSERAGEKIETNEVLKELTSIDAPFAKIVADNTPIATTAKPLLRLQCFVLPHHPPAGLHTYFG